jgi:PAS domain-containing protein
LLVAVIFGGYEVIERVWFQGASPGVRHMLHLIRGTGTSVLVGLVIGWYLLRRVPPIFPTAEATRDLASIESLSEATLRQNARWFITMRWVVVGVTAIGVLIGVLGFRLLPEETLVHLLAAVGGLAVSNLIFANLLPRVRRFARLLTVQVVSDLVLLTALLHFSGGIENPFSRVYIFHIVLAAILLPARLAYALTAVASLLLAAMAFAEAAGVLAHYPIALFPYSAQAIGDYAASYWPFVLGKVTSCLLVFWVTAYFAVIVREQVRMRETELRSSWEKVRASERQLNGVVNSLGAGLILWSADQRLLWSNDVANRWMRLVDGERPESCLFLLGEMAS